MLGYNPGGSQHGYLWWMSWLGHARRTLFSTQDAAGTFRPVFPQLTCTDVALIVAGQPQIASLLNLVTTILTNAQVCPSQASAVQAAYRNYKSGSQVSGTGLTARLTKLLDTGLGKH